MGLLQFIGAAFSRLRRNSSTFFSEGAKDSRHQLGARGEKIAARYLRKQGYKVLYRNFRPPNGGEIDLVCRDGETLVFVEVKTRSSERYGTPAEAVSVSQEKQIIRGALAWLRLLGNPAILIRFDIIEVYSRPEGEEVRIIPNAFSLPENMRV